MKNYCDELHQLCANLPRYKYPFKDAAFPQNGIYIVFEDGETAHGTDRIVRVGTHTGHNNLKARLSEHFYTERKDRSVFRKNIGRAFLHKTGDPYLKIWNIDRTVRKNRERYRDKIDIEKEQKIEQQVSKYIRERISFAVLPVDDKGKRLELESKIIGAVSLCEACTASKHWLGLSSPKEKIRNSGLWQEQGLGIPLAAEDMKLLRKIAHA